MASGLEITSKFRIRTGFGLSQWEINCVIFVVEKQYFVHLWTWISKVLNLLDYGWTWTELQKFRTGPGQQNITVHSSLA